MQSGEGIDYGAPSTRREVLEQALRDAGFDDLRSAPGFYVFAIALRDGPMSSSFEEINDRVGTANGVGSGRVKEILDDLTKKGYLVRSQEAGVVLTPRGLSAAAVLGIHFE